MKPVFGLNMGSDIRLFSHHTFERFGVVLADAVGLKLTVGFRRGYRDSGLLARDHADERLVNSLNDFSCTDSERKR